MARALFTGRLIAAFVLATCIFSFLVLFAYGVSYWNYQQTIDRTSLLSLSIAELDTLILNSSCDSSVLFQSSELFDRAASQLRLVEKRFGKYDERVLFQKKLYAELQWRHLIIAQHFHTACGAEIRPFLFFYSNRNAALLRESERMGFILTSFERRDPIPIVIYSFDADLDSNLTQELVKGYNVTRAPIVYYNGSLIYPRSINDLEGFR